jgi:hypothetical protein
MDLQVGGRPRFSFAVRTRWLLAGFIAYTYQDQFTEAISD